MPISPRPPRGKKRTQSAETIGRHERSPCCGAGQRVDDEREKVCYFYPVAKITTDEAEDLINKGVTFVDVRTEEEFQDGHVPGAINIPVDKLATKLKSLPKNKEYVAYCRGPFCVFADDAVQLLFKKGYRAKRLEEGFPDWKLRGLPVETV